MYGASAPKHGPPPPHNNKGVILLIKSKRQSIQFFTPNNVEHNITILLELFFSSLSADRGIALGTTPDSIDSILRQNDYLHGNVGGGFQNSLMPIPLLKKMHFLGN
jgi:hypothetical protein